MTKNIPGVAEKVCTHCGDTRPIDDFRKDTHYVDGHHSWCTRCRYAATNAWNKRVRQETIGHYGGSCACCGELEFAFLCIDHINGGGHRQRKAEVSGMPANWWRSRGYPEGFQVLCYNCNLAKGIYGICPHEGGA